LELINRARLDLAVEAARYCVSLNEGLGAGAIGTEALQVLAPSDTLSDAADAHSLWMLATNSFSYGGARGSTAGDRIQNNNYEFQGQWAWRENLAWVGSTGSINLQAAIEQHHQGLYKSSSHRMNTFAGNMQEACIRQVAGQLNQNWVTNNSSMLTVNLPSTGSDVFLTSVSFRDTDKDGFYFIGEGMSGVWFLTDDAIERTASAGGYGIEVAPKNILTVKIGSGQKLISVVETDLSDGYVKLDLVFQADGTRLLQVSGDTTLVWGVGSAELLGSGNLTLTGNVATNYLKGNFGYNIIDGDGGNDVIWGMGGTDLVIGGYGNDRIYGGAGSDLLISNYAADNIYGESDNDKLFGGDHADELYVSYGNDRFDGGAGSDVMTGGPGSDLFIFSAGHDVIMAFDDNSVNIAIRSWLGDEDMAVVDLMRLGEIQNGNAVFDFGNNQILTLVGVDDLSILANDMIII
jgi:Ca2+-binding RTX toxin-like protein